MSPSRVLKSPPVLADPGAEGQRLDREEVEALMASAHEAGYAQGRSEADAALADAAERLTGALGAVLHRVDDVVQEQVALDAAAVVELAALLAEWFLGARVAEDPDLVVHAIERVLAEHGDHGPLEIHAAPELVDHLTRRFAPMVDRVRADATLGPADFVIRTSGPTIDARWSDALAHARLVMLGESALVEGVGGR